MNIFPVYIFVKRKGTTTLPPVSTGVIVINRKDNHGRPCAPRNNCSLIADIYFTHTWTCSQLQPLHEHVGGIYKAKMCSAFAAAKSPPGGT